MLKSVYEQIKKQNGETFARAIRTIDTRIFDIPNLPEILKYAGRNRMGIIPFLRGLIKEMSSDVDISQSPFELLKQAGYDAFYADTAEKKNAIEPYFAKGETLCTFRDTERHKNYHIIHCIKEGADKLKRADFYGKEERQDEYGTSVISIQILKGGGFISIKNRYNHMVKSADNTFDSNPDNIIEGLSTALKKHFDVDFYVQKEPLPAHFTYQNGCIYLYNFEIDNTYFGDGFYLKNGIVHKIDTNSSFLVDFYLFDLKEKKVTNLLRNDDPYVQIMNEEIKGKKLQKKVKEGETSLYLDGELFFRTDSLNQVREITLFKTTVLPDNDFRNILSNIKVLKAPELKKMGCACCSGEELREFDLPKLEEMGDRCFANCNAFSLKPVVFPELKKIGSYCFYELHNLKTLMLPKLEEVGNMSFQYCSMLEELIIPAVKKIGSRSVVENEKLKKVIALQLAHIGDYAFNNLPKVKSLYFPALETLGDSSIRNNNRLNKVFAPKLKTGGRYCLCENQFGCYVEAPSLTKLGQGSLKKGSRLYAPLLTNVNFIENQFHQRMVQSHLKIKQSDSYFSLFHFLMSYKKQHQQSG